MCNVHFLKWNVLVYRGENGYFKAIKNSYPKIIGPFSEEVKFLDQKEN